MAALRIGILGTANIAKRSVIPTLINLPEQFQIIGVGGREPNKTKGFAEELGINAYDSYTALLDAQPDLVYIPLPNGLHFQWAHAALSRGIHVVCEKSLGCTLSEVEQLTQLALERKLLVLEHFQFRFHRQLEALKTAMESIGEVRAIRSSFCIPPFSDPNNIRYVRELGGGALLDNGAYITKLAPLLLGESVEVTACQLNHGHHTVDVWGDIHLRSKKTGIGMHGVFGFDHIYRCDVEIIGSCGRITTDRIYTAPAAHPASIQIQKQVGYNTETHTVVVEPDDHFKNLWLHVHTLLTSDTHYISEHDQNLLQATLLAEASRLAYEH